MLGKWFVFLSLFVFFLSGFNFLITGAFILCGSGIFLLILAYRIWHCDPFEYEEFRRKTKERIERQKAFFGL